MGEYNTKDRSYPTYIYPRRDHVVLGSTYLAGDGDKEIRDDTTTDIIARAAEFVPELATAKVLSVVVCIRPGTCHERPALLCAIVVSFLRPARALCTVLCGLVPLLVFVSVPYCVCTPPRCRAKGRRPARTRNCSAWRD